MAALDDTSAAVSDHSQGCCEGCNMKISVQTVQRLGEPQTIQLDILKAVGEMEDLDIHSITEKKTINFLKGVPEDIISIGQQHH